MPVLSFALAAIMVVASAVPTLSLPGSAPPDQPLFPAAPGYLLPWEGGRIHDVTQGEETTFTHNGLTAYGYDFNLNYDTIVAARSGKVHLIRDDSNSGGCDPSFASASNYVVIDHGDGTAALYLHIAHASATVAPGDLVEQGQPIAISGETGVTCNDEGGPGPHLHFQVQLFDEQQYFTQSQPIAFDDISDSDGVPVEAESYVSANYGSGKPQKIRLTPRRVPRVFNPQAVAANPLLIEAHPASPTPEPPPAEPPPPADALPSVEATATATPEETPTPEDTPTPDDTPTPESTPTPAVTDTPVPVETATAQAEGTAPPASTATGGAAAAATLEPDATAAGGPVTPSPAPVSATAGIE